MRPIPFPHNIPLLVAASLAGVWTGWAPRAAAQGDVNRPAPNVLLLVDTSASMEFKSNRVGCADPAKPCFPQCFPANTNDSQHERSRWLELVEVLTGSLDNYACYSHDRTRTDFVNEFRLDGFDPYDRNFSKPYHRPISNGCVPGPGLLPAASTPYAFPLGAIGYRPFSTSGYEINYGVSSCSGFAQSADGLLDAFNGQVRFGLMTFDTHYNEGDGIDGSGSADYRDGINGAWSYYLSGSCPAGSPTSYCSGNPQGCASEFAHEVGARNAAAPPWEGRMVAFGPPNATATELSTRNQWIQDILLATRPYGATPVAGLMHDARDFLVNDTNDDPLNPGQKFGPSSDTLIFPGCRENTLILLSDGEPNLDLRPFCETGDGVCPYQTPQEIARDLANNHATRTFAIGFAVAEVDPEGTGTLTRCEDLAQTSYCNNPAYAQNEDLQACCVLNEIAFEGTPTAQQGAPEALDHALFPQDAVELRQAISQVLSRTLGAITARTRPVFSTGAASNSSGETRAMQFTSGVDVRTFDLWRGVLSRTRLRCNSTTGEAEEIPFSVNEGDDFIANVNSPPGANPRRFYTVLGDANAGPIQSDRTMRPNLPGTDGLGSYSGNLIDAAGQADSAFAAAIPPEAIRVNEATCDSGTQDLSATECRDRYLRWLVGLPNGTQEHRCAVPGSSDCNLVGDIFHSTPVVRTKPDEFLRDEAYTRFATQLNERNTFLYTSSNDGFLHAFYVGPGKRGGRDEVNSQTNNEQWAFVPPAVLPMLPTQYPNSRRPLLDSTAVIKDVIAMPTTGTYPFRLERRFTDAESGSGEYRTILVQSFGPLRGGYFALDITEPEFDSANPDSGPKFLWQLTTDADGTPLFGKSGTTPLITTVFMDVNGNDDNREVAVAVLPGGDGGSATGETCDLDTNLLIGSDPNTFSPRNRGRCYTGDPGARSLTIVRLDTGQIVRSFRPADSPETTLLSTLVTPMSTLPSPMVGEPAAYPGGTGEVADRVFMGDRDGRVWRLDVSDTDPSDWELQVFFDTYTGHEEIDDAQPIVTPPMLSVDDDGNITLNVSTGDQEVLTATDAMVNYVYSVTEVLDSNRNWASKVNWRTVLQSGERVAGPMTLFDRKLFFSTFKPDSGAACESGQSTVWGVNYIRPRDTGSLDAGGAPEFPDADAPNDPSLFRQSLDPVDGVVFGVGIRQQPTCSATELTDQTGDDFLGYGTFNTTTFANPGKFELVIQAGGSSTQNTAGLARTTAIPLPNPASPVRIDSWAAIFE